MATKVALIGSTGSIGTQAIEVMAADPDRYEVAALAANRSVPELAEQVRRLRPPVVGLADATRAAELQDAIPAGVEVRAGAGALESLTEGADVVLNAVVGFAGLGVTLATLHGGRRLALANKESLVAAGPVVARARQTPGAEIIPVDSEHAALHQCLRAGELREVAQLVLTASGGPFRGRSAAELAEVTVEDALAHPTWSMGPKITVDSSTLMNKGLEVIEAHELFGLGYDQIEVVIHPQSIIHSMVTFTDGSSLAQLSLPDMRLPIAYALGYPKRSRTPFGALDFTESQVLELHPPDRRGFPCLDLAFEAGHRGGTAPTWLNAANEVAVEAFLAGTIAWSGIARVVSETLAGYTDTEPRDPGDIFDADSEARRRAHVAVSVAVAAGRR